MRLRLLLAATLAVPFLMPAASGPAKGALIVVGGGEVGTEIAQRFIELAGGSDAPIVVIPTAAETDSIPNPVPAFLRKAGATNITVLHTRDPKLADTAEFVAPLRNAKAVWFNGGRQWRLVDAYMGTRTEREIRNVLERGGVIAGSSAGATIQGSYLVRGAREGNSQMMAPGYEKGFGYLQGVAVDQHLITRKREKDMLQVIDKHPELLGIGLDEGTAIVVHGDVAEVIGVSRMAVYDPKYKPQTDGPRYYWLQSGDRFNLRTRTRVQ
ncbi:MAG: cyanophycinase [Bryobacteraceae bacterium]|nr:cyanophycinase [Bryobacteraceae bacterium]